MTTEQFELVDQLRVRIYPNRAALGAAAAADIGTHIRNLLARQGTVRIIFAAAPSQGEMLAGLAHDDSIDWSRVTAFHMDEYIGLAPDAPQRFSTWLRDHLFDLVRPGTLHVLHGQSSEIETYARLLQEAPIDIVCLGIGENGHIAFNDPPDARFDDPAPVRIVELDHASRQQQVNDGCFDELGAVPRQAITLTIPALLAGRRLFCCVPGPTKRAAVTRALRGPIAESCPASILRRHPDCTLYVDGDAYVPA